MLLRVALALLCIAAYPASAEEKPNFSGRWKLNVAESSFTDKRAPPPDSLLWTLEHRGDKNKYTVAGERQGKKNGFTADLHIGGAPHESDAAGIITVEWKGDSLVVDTLYNPDNERRASMEEIWTLSEDSKTLTDTVVFHMPSTAKDQSDVKLTRVFHKQ
jgi:hypothetical protein